MRISAYSFPAMFDPLRALKALADPARLRLAVLLLDRELSGGELADILGMAQPSASRNLKQLAEAGLLTVRREGAWAFFAAETRGQAGEFLRSTAPFLRAAPEAAADPARFEAFAARRSAQSERFFDALAAEWTEVSRAALAGFDLPGLLAATLEEELSGLERPTIVDLGCGPGELLARLAAPPTHSRLNGPRLIGIDASPRMLDAARARLAGAASLRRGDLERLPLADGEVGQNGAAVAAMVLHHLAEPRRALAEARRALKPGGLLVVADLDPHADEAMRERMGDRRLGVSPEELALWLAETGFSEPVRTKHQPPGGLAFSVSLARAI